MPCLGEQEYRKKFYSEDYLKWIRDSHLPLPAGAGGSTTSSPPVSTGTVCSQNCGESPTSSLSDVLALPKPVPSIKTNRKPAVNVKASCTTDTGILEKLVQLKEEKEAKEEEQEREKKGERQRKKDLLKQPNRPEQVSRSPICQ